MKYIITNRQNGDTITWNKAKQGARAVEHTIDGVKRSNPAYRNPMMESEAEIFMRIEQDGSKREVSTLHEYSVEA